MHNLLLFYGVFSFDAESFHIFTLDEKVGRNVQKLSCTFCFTIGRIDRFNFMCEILTVLIILLSLFSAPLNTRQIQI